MKWLFSQYIAHNNIWTASNQWLDLCRYTGCQIKLFRHPTVDFAIFYDRQPPFDIDKLTYTELQPQNILLKRKRRILLSRAAKPWGKPYIKLKIKPPKQMSTKWFFQQDFCQYGLVKLCASACDFSYPSIGPLAASTILTIYSLDINFYNISNWAATKQSAYYPYGTKPTVFYKYATKGTLSDTQKIGDDFGQGRDAYYKSINYTTGWFNKNLIGGITYTDITATTKTAAQPLIVLRYNPELDDGVGNEVYLTSLFSTHYDKPSVTENYHLNNLPLWMAFLWLLGLFKNYFKGQRHNGYTHVCSKM